MDFIEVKGEESIEWKGAKLHLREGLYGKAALDYLARMATLTRSADTSAGRPRSSTTGSTTAD